MDGAVLLAVLVAGIVGAAVIVALLRGWGRRRSGATSVDHAGIPTDLPQLSDRDRADLETAFAQVTLEDGPVALSRVHRRLALLVSRGVPVRWIRPTTPDGPARVCFADGTVIRATGACDGDLLTLLVEVRRRPVRLTSVSDEAGRLRLEFAVGKDRRLGAYAVGLDQPD